VTRRFPAARPAPRVRARLRAEDDFGIALVLIMATIVTLATIGDAPLGQLLGIALGGGTLLFVLRTSAARQRTIRAVGVLVAVGLGAVAVAAGTGSAPGTGVTGLIGLMLAFVAPVTILRRIATHETITARTILGALCVYLLIGLGFAYAFALLQIVGSAPFFTQLAQPRMSDFVYFSYITQATVGYGDLTPAQDLGRMVAVSEALIGQLYLVSAVALLVGNLGGRARRHRDDGEA
jgi:hypothetical protein